MKLKSFLILAISLGALIVLAWCSRTNISAVSPSISYEQFLSWSSFLAPIKSGRWFEWKISWNIVLWSEASQANIAIDWRIGFWWKWNQKFVNYKWRLWSYDIVLDWLEEDDKVFIRSWSQLISGAVWDWFIETLLGKLNQTNGQFVYLRGYAPTQRLWLLIQPQKTLTSLSEYVAFDELHCDQKKCQIILDQDLLWVDIQNGSNISYKKMYEWLNNIRKQSIYFYPKQEKLEISQLSFPGQDFQWSLTRDTLHINYVSKWLYKRVYDISHFIQQKKHIIDFAIDQDGETVQSRRAQYEIYPDGGKLKLDSMLSGSTLSLQGEWFDIDFYLPINKGKTIDVYGLIWN